MRTRNRIGIDQKSAYSEVHLIPILRQKLYHYKGYKFVIIVLDKQTKKG